ncbi:MAG: aldehyde dehydrogenase family protein, partial [Acidobacteriota bacterium]|nr:aldehyde dehydrogenase family protein [Acidobacteriota bacterium]
MLTQEVNAKGYFVDGAAHASTAAEYFDIYNPSTGEVLGRVPDCTVAEVDSAVASAVCAFRPWADTPAMKRVQVLY